MAIAFSTHLKRKARIISNRLRVCSHICSHDFLEDYKNTSWLVLLLSILSNRARVPVSPPFPTLPKPALPLSHISREYENPEKLANFVPLVPWADARLPVGRARRKRGWG